MSGAVVITVPTERRPVEGSDAKTPHAKPMALASADRPVPHLPARRAYSSLIGLLIFSVLVHSTLLWVFVQTPQELPSIGIPAISVEIVIGDDAPAGVAATPGQEERPLAKQEAPQPSETATLQEPVTVTRSTELQQIVEDAVRPDETGSMTEEGAASEPKQLASMAPKAPDAAPEPEPIVLEVQPKAPEVQATLSPQPSEQPKPDPAKPVTTDRRAEPGAKQPPLASAPASQSASGISRGRSTADANYAARVAAHLARHKQFPAEARRRGQQGSASVSFNIDGVGRVTEVRLVGSAGSAILDREAQSMVRRASPFPPPPGGQPQSFSVPVSFSMR